MNHPIGSTSNPTDDNGVGPISFTARKGDGLS
jgi:hypothetical protein